MFVCLQRFANKQENKQNKIKCFWKWGMYYCSSVSAVQLLVLRCLPSSYLSWCAALPIHRRPVLSADADDSALYSPVTACRLCQLPSNISYIVEVIAFSIPTSYVALRPSRLHLGAALWTTPYTCVIKPLLEYLDIQNDRKHARIFNNDSAYRHKQNAQY